jgi:hypothetical protein
MLREGIVRIVMASRRPLLALTLSVTCLTLACLGPARVAPSASSTASTSPTMLPLVYYEDGAVLFVGVDARAAQYAKDGETMFPVGIGLGNRARRMLDFDRESFILETAEGRRYPLVTVQEFNQGYKRSASDRELAGPFLEALQVKFDPQHFRSRAFFPTRGTSSRDVDQRSPGPPGAAAVALGPQTVASFELGPTDWTHMYLYFPIPEEGLHKERFKLLVSAKGEPDPFVVGFEVR